jgi:nitrate reductase beta subunit
MTAFDVMDDKFHLTAQPADSNGAAAPADKGRRINLLNWDGKNTNGLFTATPGTNGAAKDQAHAPEHIP